MTSRSRTYGEPSRWAVVLYATKKWILETRSADRRGHHHEWKERTMASFKLVTLDSAPAAVVSETVPVRDLPAFFGRAFDAAAAAAKSQGVEVVGQPFALYNGAPTDVIDVSGGFRVSAAIQPVGDVGPMELPGGRAVTTIYVGPYDMIESTYAKMHVWMSTKRLTPASRMWEVYLSDPMTEPDPSAWRTQIVWPVDN